MPATVVPPRSTRRGGGWWARRLLTTDYFPATERAVKRLVWNPAGAMLLAAAVALLCGLLLSPHALVLAAGLFAVLAVGVAWPWLTLRGTTACLVFDTPRCREGDAVGVTHTVTRRPRWAAGGLAIRGGFGPSDPTAPAPVVAAFPHVAGRASVSVSWTFTPSRRGAYPPADPPRLVTGYPFGLREARAAVAVPAALIVWPAVYPVGAVPDLAGAGRTEGAVARAKAGPAGDVLGVRPYRRGDSPRRVHWAQTAKHDRLVVCELQANARPRVQVVLDAAPAAHRGNGPDSSREWAVRVAASLIEGWLAQGAEVGAVIGGGAFPPAAGADHRRRLLDALALLPDDGPPLADLLAAPGCRSFAAGLQVVVTTDHALAALGAEATGTGRRFFVLEADGFLATADPTGDVRLPVRPWVRVAAPGGVRHALRFGWKEAAHGG